VVNLFLIFYRATKTQHIQKIKKSDNVTPVAGLNLCPEKVFRFPNSPQNSNSEDLFQVMSKQTQYSREKDKTLFSEFFLHILSI